LNKDVTEDEFGEINRENPKNDSPKCQLSAASVKQVNEHPHGDHDQGKGQTSLECNEHSEQQNINNGFMPMLGLALGGAVACIVTHNIASNNHDQENKRKKSE